MTPIFQKNRDITHTPTSSEADVEPLASETKQGASYQRPADVEAEQRAVLLLSESDWLRDRKKYRPETIMRLIRETRLGDPHLYGSFVEELGDRILPIVRNGARELDPSDAAQVAETVRSRALRIILTNTPARQADFLEIRFAAAIAGYTSDACKPYRGKIARESERPMEVLLSRYASPEQAVIQLRSREQVKEITQRARQIATDPRHVDAVLLHIMDAMPIISSDPNEDTLTRHFDVSLGQIKWWLKQGMKALRQAAKELGVRQ